ncbi:hypothetical protein [Pseudomonas aeruginosa]|uniref:hypothetical protein n=1 Tax=Pseudomonas aeruginosa TaxID=287 RepID=UPI003D7698C0
MVKTGFQWKPIRILTLGAVEGVEQFVAELADEILKAQGQRVGFRVQQFALHGRGFSGSGFEIEGHGDAPKKNGACTTPAGQWHAPWWEENRRVAEGG